MFGRYRRLVPKAHRDLIRAHGLPRPNWFVGSAEKVYVDDALLRQIDEIKAEITKRAAAPRKDQT